MTDKDTDLIKQMNLYKNKKIVLWGATSFGEDILKVCRRIYNIEVVAFCDNNNTKWGNKISGVKVVSPTELVKIDSTIKELDVIITSTVETSYNAISTQLDNMGINNYTIAKTMGLPLLLIRGLIILDGLTKTTLDIYEKLLEGFVREIISKIQTMRKESDFEVQDHIIIGYANNDFIADIITKNKDIIMNEILANDVIESDNGTYTKNWKVNNEEVTFSITKA